MYLSKTKKIFFLAFSFFVFLSFYLSFPPINFPVKKVLTIEKGASLRQIGNMLVKEEVIRSRIFFNVIMLLSGKESGAVFGNYIFDKPESVMEIAKRIGTGNFGFPLQKITIPEGLTVKEIAELVPSTFSFFKKDDFLKLAEEKEGLLFPDTYFLPEDITAEKFISTLEKNFEKKKTLVQKEVEASGKTLNEIMTMASIIEKETATPEDRRIVAGIFWERIKIGLALQSCATLGYVTGKGSLELTDKDLKLDSPYNTYVHKNLPPTPISNPGIDAIRSALIPTKTDYLYFLNDADGKIHYAKTYVEHLANKKKYIP